MSPSIRHRPPSAPVTTSQGEIAHRVRRGWRERIISRVRGEQSREMLEASGLRIGRNVLIAAGVSIDPGFTWLVEIGDDTIIAPRVQIIAHDAATKNVTGKTQVQRVTIGKRVYIGTAAIVLPGVTIGDDAVIGAASVVREDIPAHAVAVGVPAHVIGDTEQLRARHTALMRERPVWDWSWTRMGGITRQRMREMYDALADGPGYVD